MAKGKDSISEAEKNAKVLTDLIIDGQTTTHLQVKILNKLLEGREDAGYFETMFAEKMTLASCPSCGHQNHWFIPEDELNRMDWVTAHKDPRVKATPTEEDCSLFHEACTKRKVNM